MLEQLITLLVLLVWAVIALFVAQRMGAFEHIQWPDHRLGKPGKRQRGSGGPVGWVALIGAFILFHAVVIIVAVLNAVFTGQAPGIGFDVWVATWAYLAVLVALIVYAWLLNNRVLHFFVGKRRWRALGIGLLSWFAVFPSVGVIGMVVALIIEWATGVSEVNQVAVEQMRQLLGHLGLFVWMSLVNVILVPICEELLFRGFLHTGLRRYLNRTWGLIISAAIFSAYHYAASQAWGNAVLLVNIFVLGLCLGYLFERTGSIFASMGLHGLFNLVTILTLPFSGLAH